MPSGRKPWRVEGILSADEEKVLRLIAQGLSNDEIAAKLFVSKVTVLGRVKRAKLHLKLVDAHPRKFMAEVCKRYGERA